MHYNVGDRVIVHEWHADHEGVIRTLHRAGAMVHLDAYRDPREVRYVAFKNLVHIQPTWEDIEHLQELLERAQQRKEKEPMHEQSSESLFQEVTLWTNDRHKVTTVSVPRFQKMPEVLLWGTRVFVYNSFTNEYAEGLMWVCPS